MQDWTTTIDNIILEHLTMLTSLQPAQTIRKGKRNFSNTGHCTEHLLCEETSTIQLKQGHTTSEKHGMKLFGMVFKGKQNIGKSWNNTNIIKQMRR